ncbi:hypothetical protein BD311DRAFT_767105 [Dichomitus squalens]|uniref:Uncharacterized protein n=1 Tax=Dichomitus squalens TaxID=114155 RepID=A0A4Q9MAE5_9APHY|nr:hypothetical protein BD311DRAFT_767105 [Dichomitus squalens]
MTSYYALCPIRHGRRRRGTIRGWAHVLPGWVSCLSRTRGSISECNPRDVLLSYPSSDAMALAVLGVAHAHYVNRRPTLSDGFLFMAALCGCGVLG